LEVFLVAEAYCVKCKTKKEIQNPVEVTSKNGRPMLKGTCPSCGGKLNLFIKK
jgi:hypothetical protein